MVNSFGKQISTSLRCKGQRFAVQNNKNNVSLEGKGWTGLLEALFKSLGFPKRRVPLSNDTNPLQVQHPSKSLCITP